MRLKTRVDRLYRDYEQAQAAALRRLLADGGWCDPADSLCLVVGWGADPPDGWALPEDAPQRAERAWAAMLANATDAERRLLGLPNRQDGNGGQAARDGT